MPKQVSLSSMWSVKRSSSAREFVNKALEVGFTNVEANYQLSAEMTNALLAMDDHRVLSVHNPCPSVLVREGLWSYKIHLNTPDLDQRAIALRYAGETISLAKRFGAKAVVLHMGAVPEPVDEGSGETLQARLRRLYRDGRHGSEEYEETRQSLATWRERTRGPHLEAASQVLNTLVKTASENRIVLGLEARYYYHEIPSFDEMGWLLSQHPADVVGYWHDVGHAENLQRLGFTPHAQWLATYSHRMVGVHLHDIIGLKDHWAPGKGDMDYAMIAPHIPPHAIRVCEIDTVNDEDSLVAGLQRLRDTGIIAV